MKSESIRMKVYLSIVGLCVLGVSQVEAKDWPMWRYDSGHTSSSDHSLPEQLQLQWSRQYTPRDQAWDDPLNEDLMQYDRIFEPVVKDGRMFIGFNDADKVVAIDVDSGRELWTYNTDGPVRFPGAVWRDVVFFSCDDGYLYCLDAEDGKLRWRFRGGPSERKVIGNNRIISAWPARGAPVVDDDYVYFAASIWPFMGTFIYALDAESGDVVWINDGTSAQYIKQPHSAPSFAGVAPQGVLTMEFPHLLRLMEENQFDTIYHEHFCYFGLLSAEYRTFDTVTRRVEVDEAAPAEVRERRVTPALKVFAAFATSASEGAARDVDGVSKTLRQAAE